MLYCFLIFLIAILFFYYKQGKDKVSELRSESQTTNDSMQPRNPRAAQDSNAPPISENSQHNASTTANQTTQQKTDSLNNAVEDWSAKIHGAIEFYGKVVDENNQPVENANIKFIWSQFSPLDEATPTTNVLSDPNGLFLLQGVIGAKLNIIVTKPGYYYVRSLNKDYFTYSSLPGTIPFQPDFNNPILFHLRKKGEGAELITASLNVAIPRDGGWVGIDLLTRKPDDKGQLKFNQTKPPYETWKKATEWSFHLTISDGGFAPLTDELSFVAPESGYMPELGFDFKKDKPTWEKGIKTNLYFVFGNPPRYGKLTVETDISWDGAHVSYAINPTGSRNLEPK
jgi:hypothetical protein